MTNGEKDQQVIDLISTGVVTFGQLVEATCGDYHRGRVQLDLDRRLQRLRQAGRIVYDRSTKTWKVSIP